MLAGITAPMIGKMLGFGQESSQEFLFLELVGGFNSQEQDEVEGKKRTAKFCGPFQLS